MADVVAALSYAKRGWPVLPLHNITEDRRCTCETGESQCGSRAKHPRINNWTETASTDPDTIKGWWETPGWEDSNIGVLTGKASGLLCVDIDSKHDGIDTWNNLIDSNSPVNTLVSLTARRWAIPWGRSALALIRGVKQGLSWSLHRSMNPAIHINGTIQSVILPRCLNG